MSRKSLRISLLAWIASGYTPAVTLGAGIPIELLAEDVDAFANDRIGVCTLTGGLRVDAQGYVTPESFRCNGQLWGVALRVVPIASGDPAAAP